MSKILKFAFILLLGIVAITESFLPVINPYKEELATAQQIYDLRPARPSEQAEKFYQLTLVYAQAHFDGYQAAAEFIEMLRRLGPLSFDRRIKAEIYNRATAASLTALEYCIALHSITHTCRAFDCPGCHDPAHQFTGNEDLAKAIGKLVGQRAIDDYPAGVAEKGH